MECIRALEDCRRKEAQAVEALERLERDLAVAQALEDLLVVWAPACFALGWQVRECHWEERRPQTGGQARKVLCNALTMLLHLEAPTPGHRPRGHSDYVRTLACALLMWDRWHEQLPACCFSEEVNEATLSRLGGSMQQHPEAVEVEDVMDLYLLVRQGHHGARELRADGVDRRWMADCLRNLGDLLDGSELRPPLDAPDRLVHQMVTFVSVRGLRPEKRRQPEELDADEVRSPGTSRWSCGGRTAGWVRHPCWRPTLVRRARRR
jgi:hypothetical protein